MTEPRQVEVVRGEVRKVLQSSPAWHAMGADERRAMAQNMVTLSSYLAEDPGWLDAEVPASANVAEAMGPVDDLKKRLAKAPGQVGQDFEAGAVKQGVQEFGNLVKTVDFPAFVSGLINGVFQAIVDASIQQMQAYGELLAATAKSVGEFAADHITESQAREQIASRYPGTLRLDRDREGARLTVVDGADTTSLQAMSRSRDPLDLSSPEGEARFVQSARLELARQRQKLLAMMVLLGINRIIVTNGRINAKVVFDMRASDMAKRSAKASMDDRDEAERSGFAMAALPWGAAGGISRNKHVTTVRSSVSDDSNSSAEVKAQLTGEVRVDFRSETLPPEKLLEAGQLDTLNGIAGAGAPPAAPPRPAGTR